MGQGFPLTIVRIERSQVNPEYRCLNLVEPRIVATVGTDLMCIEPVVAAPAYPRGELLRIRRNATPIAEATEILCWIEAEGCYVSEVADMNAVHTSPMGLGAILNHN